MAPKTFTSLLDPELISIINSGGIGIIPTDTVYGLVARASDEQAVQKLYQTKPRDQPPGTLIGATTGSFTRLGFRYDQLESASHHWPAALSVILDATEVPTYLKHNRDSLPVRIPDFPALATLLEQTGPLMTTSANAPKQPTSTTIDMAIDYFGDEVDFYVDSGDLSGRPSSTIIGFDDANNMIVYRQGAVAVDDLPPVVK